jgi:peptidoglycan/LPS O-acetylase OafA/YrhL
VNNYKTKQRRDINGLRGLAVLLVIFYHLGISFVPAGFVGVDVFFVISGFLITSHLLRDFNQGHFSLKYFYLRRMRRILPALLVVLLVTTVAAFVLLFNEDLVSYGQTLVAALLSYSNLYFLNHIHFGYFATDATVIPLLHTWSLGVEEQFYIVWPLLLMALYRVKSQRFLLPLSVLLGVLSFALYYGQRGNLPFVYFMPLASL